MCHNVTHTITTVCDYEWVCSAYNCDVIIERYILWPRASFVPPLYNIAINGVTTSMTSYRLHYRRILARGLQPESYSRYASMAWLIYLLPLPFPLPPPLQHDFVNRHALSPLLMIPLIRILEAPPPKPKTTADEPENDEDEAKKVWYHMYILHML